MDIQEMVDARLEQLRAQRQSKNTTPATAPARDIEQIRDFRKELAKLSDLADTVFTVIAGQVLDVTERLSRDCARLEREVLHTRLMLLESAESVLDQALSLRRQIKKVIEGGLEEIQLAHSNSGAPKAPGHLADLQPAREPARPRKRANMMANGVSDLFRNTHR